MPQLPDAAAFAEFSRLILLIIGTVLTLFGLGLYHGALRLFGSLIGGSAGLLLYFANRGDLPDLGSLGSILFPIVFAIVGGWIGAWLAEFAHYVLFFLIGCLTGFIAIHTQQGHLSLTALQADTWTRLPSLSAIHWMLIVIFGLIYLAAANWMIAITAAILGASMVAGVLDNRLVLYIGAPIGILLQYALFLRREEYRQYRHPQRENGPERRSQVIYDRGDGLDD